LLQGVGEETDTWQTEDLEEEPLQVAVEAQAVVDPVEEGGGNQREGQATQW